MPEKAKALFRGATDERGIPLEWLGEEGAAEAGQPPEPAVPARHLSAEEYAALSPRNKERVRAARAAGGGPLYEVRSNADANAAAKAGKEGGE